uniref:HMG box domain-containing protein n=1 Tax=Globodera rostochiensis TaxID=31243 RepID=A0A914IGS6_GLORO
MALCQKFGRLLIGAEARFSARTDLTNISTSLDHSPAPTQIPAWLPYNAPKPFALFTKDQLNGQSGGGAEAFKILSTNWKNLSEEEKQSYSERAKKIGDELRDNFEKLTNGQKKDLWDKHVEKMNNRMKRKQQKFYAETNRPKRPMTSYSVFMQKCFEKQTEPIKTRDKVKKFVAEMAQQWRQMTDAEKRPYVDQTQCNIAAYHKEMTEWKQKYTNEIRALKEAEATLKARGTQFTEAFEWNIDDDRDVEEEEAIQQMLLDDSTHLVERREWSSDDRDVEEEEAAIQQKLLDDSTHLVEKRTEQRRRQRRRRSSHSAHIPSRLPSGYNAPIACSLFTKDQMTGQSGGPELLKIVSTNWKSLSKEEKQSYSERAKKIGDELRDKFEKLTNRQKKDLWDKHVEKRNKLQILQMKKKLHKFYAETNRPKRPLPSYMLFMKERFEKQTEPIKTNDELKKFAVETGQQWRQMTDAEKLPYVDQMQYNLAAYHKEMAEWKQKYANEIRAWKEAEAEAALKARDTQFTEAFFEWNIVDDDRDLNEKEAIQQMLLDDSTHLVERREWSSDDDDRIVEEEEAIQRMFLAISTYLGRKETSQNQRIEY